MNIIVVRAIIPVIMSGTVIFCAQIIDEKAAIPLFTAIGAMAVVAGLIWKMATQYKGIMDRLDIIEKTKLQSYDDSDLKSEIADLRISSSEVKAEISSLRVVINRLSNDRFEDMEHLRTQLRSGSMLEPLKVERRILLVDDNNSDVDLFRIRMQGEFFVDSASSLKEAHRKINQQTYDCVLLDLDLPDTYNVNNTVSQFIKDNPNQLCIVLTGNPSEVVRNSCLQQGADDVWIKGRDDKDIKMIGRRLLDAIWRKRRR